MNQQQRGGLETETSTIVPSGRKFLFGIGINAYQHLRPLRNAVKDLEDLTKVLLERYDFDESRLKLLKNEQATRKNIINTLYDLTNSDLLSVDDSLLIYFSGHGVLDKNQEGYWVPVESERGDIDSFIPNLVVQSKIKNMKCRHVLLISDSCFSGSLLARADSYIDDTIVADALESRKSRWIITSGGRDETVLDGSGSNSPFAEAILSELRHNHQPKLLTDKLALRIRDITRANAPQMSQAEKLYEAGDLGGRFVFNLRDREADDWQAALSENSVLGFQAFKNRYPGSSHRAEAQKYIDALTEQAAWEAACKANRLWTYNDFINNYPQSTFVGQALQKIAELEDQEDWNRVKVTQTLSAYWEYKTKHPAGRFLKEANTEIDELRKQNEAKQAALEQEFNRIQAEKQRSDAAKKQEEKDKRQEERRLAKIRQEEAIEKKKNEQTQAEAQVGKQPLQNPQVYQPMPSKPHDEVDNGTEQEDAMSSDGLWGRYKNSMGVVIGAALLFLAIYAIVVKQPFSKSSIEATKDTATAIKNNLSDNRDEVELTDLTLDGGVVLKGVSAKGIEANLLDFIKSERAADKTTWFNFDRLIFETGRATLKPESQEQLKNIAKILKAYPDVNIKLGGYTDNTGNANSNLKLSVDRVVSVKGELVKLGIADIRVDSEGYGQEHPVADNATEEGRAQNRRISVRVTKR